jgi:hypothetical protein
MTPSAVGDPDVVGNNKIGPPHEDDAAAAATATGGPYLTEGHASDEEMTRVVVGRWVVVALPFSPPSSAAALARPAVYLAGRQLAERPWLGRGRVVVGRGGSWSTDTKAMAGAVQK